MGHQNGRIAHTFRALRTESDLSIFFILRSVRRSQNCSWSLASRTKVDVLIFPRGVDEVGARRTQYQCDNGNEALIGNYKSRDLAFPKER